MNLVVDRSPSQSYGEQNEGKQTMTKGSANEQKLVRRDEDVVLLERRDEILIISLNRPDQRNAVNQMLAAGLSAALDQLDGDPTLRVGIITGVGKGFCAGMDLKAFVNGESPFAGDRGWGGICKRPSEKPLIAAIEGFAVAGGLEIALACDLIVAAREAQLGIPEVKRGLVAAAGGLFRLPKRIPYNLAMQLALTGEPIRAERAYQLGLVNEICETGAALEGAVNLARRICVNLPAAVGVSKAIIVRTLDQTEAEAWETQTDLARTVLRSADALEGASAFADKRSAKWNE